MLRLGPVLICALLSFPAYATAPAMVNNRQINEGEIARLLESEQFDTLEAIASELRTKKSRFPSGEWQLGFFYDWIKTGSQTVGVSKKDAHLRVLANWAKPHPESVTHRVALAYALIHYAWEARGGGWASTVTEEGWKQFHEDLTKAWDVLNEARNSDVKDPAVYSALMTVGMGLNKDAEGPGLMTSLLSAVTGVRINTNEMETIFQEGVALEPAYYPIYYNRTISLLPRWGGAPGEVEAFAERAIELTRDQEGEALYARIAGQVLSFAGSPTFLHRFNFSWPRIRQGHLDILDRFPYSSYRRNWFCRFASLFKAKDPARRLFDEIGDDWDSYVWEDKAAFDRWKSWAYGQVDWPGPRALHYAADMGYASMAYGLLKGGEDINARDEHGRTPLYIAAWREGTEMVELLMEQGADVNLAANHGWTPLYCAVEDGEFEMARLLIQKGADVNIAIDNKLTPLYVAVANNQSELAALLLEHGANANASTHNGWFPLARACNDRNIQLVRMLLRNGADVRQTMERGWTALHVAALNGSVEILRILLDEEGVDVDVTNDAQSTPLHRAAFSGHNAVVQLLLDKGAEVNPRMREGFTPLGAAKEEGHMSTVELLHKHGGVE